MLKILVVEDDSEINRLLCDYLQAQNINTLHAVNGREALNMVRGRADIDLVLLDLMLPL